MCTNYYSSNKLVLYTFNFKALFTYQEEQWLYSVWVIGIVNVSDEMMTIQTSFKKELY